ncbi:phage protein [Asticcacaulis excentricus]|uniref:Phage protein n=2 Tax=Asticcacaulis excentricus TaxID=78587 RepID=A0A3G9G4C9_9CAUL|nr:phage protein [Asticcacaulis excentricus]
MRRWADMKQVRQHRETEWQMIADYFLPRKNFLVQSVKGAGVPRRVMTSKPQMALGRFAGMLVGYLVDPTRPFIKPNVSQGLVNAGRRIDLDRDSADYLDNLGWSMFDRFMLPKARFMPALNQVALELGAFGTAVMWVGRKRGWGPRYMSRPLRACWIDVDDNDVVDTVFYEFELPLELLVGRYPKALQNPDLKKLYEDKDKKNHTKKIKVLHCIYPREGGEAGGIAERKPYAERIIAHEYKGADLSESGYDSFPYAVPRLGISEGNPYGQGLAWIALPSAISLNRMQDLVEYGIGTRVAPPMFVPTRLFKQPSRDLGYFNYYDPKLLGFSSLKDLVQYMPAGGDVGIGVDWMRYLSEHIDDAFNIDWMKLREAGNVTAEEIAERRSLRMTAQTGLLAAVDRDLMGVLGDRTLEVMSEEGMIGEAPQQLRGVDVDWDYAGPLAIAQQRNQYQAVQSLIDITAKIAQIEPDAAAALQVEECLRLASEALGAPPTVLESRVVYQEELQRRRALREQAQQAQIAQAGGAAMRDASQGVATMAQAAPQPSMGMAMAA